MAATRVQLLWGRLTDIVALNRNADDRLIRVLEHSRDRYVIELVGAARQELEKARQELISVRDAREDDK